MMLHRDPFLPETHGLLCLPRDNNLIYKGALGASWQANDLVSQLDFKHFSCESWHKVPIIENIFSIAVPKNLLKNVNYYLSVKLTENTFSFAATTWGIVTGDERANCKLGIIR